MEQNKSEESESQINFSPPSNQGIFLQIHISKSLTGIGQSGILESIQLNSHGVDSAESIHNMILIKEHSLDLIKRRQEIEQAGKKK